MTIEILHVDDEPDIREVAALALGLDPGITLRAAASGEEALAILGSGYRPSVVLLDVMMPVVDGPGVLARMRADPQLDQTPVIFMTARVQGHEREHYIALGAIGVITKPFDPMTLAQEVRMVLAKAGL